MNYPLAKEIKDAGFSLRRHPNQSTQPQDGAYVIDHVQYYIPTLEELIEALGQVNIKIEYSTATKFWLARTYTAEDACAATSGFCSTPTITAAMLWLALNKKQ